jgi:hypothetical protein
VSHCPGHRLEDFLTDWCRVVDDKGDNGTSIRHFYANQLILSEEQFKKLVEIYEPAREALENCIDMYNEEENGSWRDYRNFTVADCIPDNIEKAGCEYLESIRQQCKTTKGLTMPDNSTLAAAIDQAIIDQQKYHCANGAFHANFCCSTCWNRHENHRSGEDYRVQKNTEYPFGAITLGESKYADGNYE